MNDVTAPVVVDIPPQPAAVEAAADGAVEIAEIQADRDVKIAEIQAETTETAIEAAAEQNDEDVQWLIDELEGLRASHATLAGELSAERLTREELAMQVASLTETVTAHAAILSLMAPPEIPETPETPEAPDPSTLEPLSEKPNGEAQGGPEKTSEKTITRAVRKKRWLV